MKKTKNYNELKILNNFDSAWDILLVSFKLIFKNIHYLIRINIKFLISSLIIVSIPVANSIMIQNIHTLMRTEGVIKYKKEIEVEESFKKLIAKSYICSILQLIVLVVIFFSINFWLTQSKLELQIFSILAIYGLVLYLLISNYIFISLVLNKNININKNFKLTFWLIFKRPFESLLFTVVSLLLLIFGIILLGPILLLIPVSRSFIAYLSYLYLTNNIAEINMSK